MRVSHISKRFIPITGDGEDDSNNLEMTVLQLKSFA